MSSKGRLVHPDCRARYVACEVKTYDDHACIAGTPPLGAKRVLMSQLATEMSRAGERLKLHFADARNAYFNGTPQRPSLPKFRPNSVSAKVWLEGCTSPCMGRVMRAPYGNGPTQRP